MRAIRFNTAFKAIRGVKVFLNFEGGLTRGAVPSPEKQVEAQAKSLKDAKKRITIQRRILGERDREIFRLRELSKMHGVEEDALKERSAFRSSGKSAAGMLPEFLIIGAQKSGTTSLYHALVSHAHVVPAFKKELHFFNFTNKFAKGSEWYRSNFLPPGSENGRSIITGEASPYYLYHPLAARRASQVVPQAKLIVLLRNPVDRAYSDYQHKFRDGSETLSFEEAIEAEEERIGGERERMLADETYLSPNHRRYSYLTRGIYVDQLKEWHEHFDRGQMLIIKSEDYFARTADVTNLVLDFLELPVWDRKDAEGGKNRGGYDPMSPAVRERLESYFEPHNQRLYEYLGQDFGW